MRTITENSLMPFGEFKGQAMRDLQEDYLCEIYASLITAVNLTEDQAAVKQYIEDLDDL